MPTELSTDEMKEFVQAHFDDFVNNQMPEVIRVNMTSDFLDHDGPGGTATGIEGDEAMMREMYLRMPGLEVRVEDMVAEADKVVCRNTWSWNEESTGAQMEFHGFVMWRFEGGKIAERWATVTQPRQAAGG